MRIGILHSRLRKDENLIIEELEKRGHTAVLFDDRELVFSLDEINKKTFDVDVMLERCMSHSRAYYSLQMLNDFAIPTVNSATTAELCGSKFLVSETLQAAGVPTPPVFVAFNRTQALKAVQTMGFPVVMKPAIGSWGTLLAKVNDIDAAQAVLAHKRVLGNYLHGVYYIQKYIQKPGRDIRVIVIDNKAIAAVYRNADFWITHLDHGATLEACPITPEIEKISVEAAKAVGGEIVAVDLAEDMQKKLWVLEVDYTVEFSPFAEVIDEGLIVREMVDYLEKKVK
ncbi:MAG: RimK family alpha-L-glutamate ligase [bacterium]